MLVSTNVENGVEGRCVIHTLLKQPTRFTIAFVYTNRFYELISIWWVEFDQRIAENRANPASEPGCDRLL